MAQHIAEGDRCFVDEEYAQAVEHYTKAIEQQPNNALAFEARAKARNALAEYEEALQDATNAIELDPQFAKAYLQQGIAYFHMEEYEAAKATLEKGHSLAPTMSKFKQWIRKCQAELDGEESGQPTAKPAVAAPTPAARAPPAAAPAPEPAAPAVAPASTSAAPAANSAASSSKAAAEDAAAAPLAPSAAPAFQGKYRHQHYHIQDKVVVDIYAKKLPKERLQVTFEPERLLVVINDDAGAEEYRLDVPLYGKIVPEESRAEVLSTKVEVSMKKADRSVAWATLEKSDKVAAPNFSDPNFHNPSYPTSYTKAPKDWNSVEAELKEQEEKGELEFGDPLNNFFKKIFSQGSDEQRRAMMKSFQESNGTVLSTNWEEVGSKKVECTPPDGMELKKFEL